MWRSWSTRVMSISNTVETWAEVRFESTMCSAVFRRMGDMGTTSTRVPSRQQRVPAPASRPAAGCAPALPRRRAWPPRRRRPACRPPCAAAWRPRAAPSRWPRMSCFVTRPPMPVPGTSRMSTWCSAAILRTTGEERVSRSSSAVISARGFSASGLATSGPRSVVRLRGVGLGAAAARRRLGPRARRPAGPGRRAPVRDRRRRAVAGTVGGAAAGAGAGAGGRSGRRCRRGGAGRDGCGLALRRDHRRRPC